MKKKTVAVVMSTYNGSSCVIKQLDSIFQQKEVEVQLYVRDDGSTDNTVEELLKYAETHLIHIQKGENVGWEKSFLYALKEAPNADYYAFSDQDDIWFENKLKTAIDCLERKDNNIPQMFHCNKLSVDENLKPLRHQVRRTPRPLNRENAFVQEFVQGCSIVMNNAAKDLVIKHIPKKKIAHDFWCGLLCYLFGEVIYDNTPRFYHISHGNNASGEGHMINSWKGRLKKFYKNSSVYYTPAKDILREYSSLLTDEDKKFLFKIINYKQSLSAKLSLLFSIKFIRDSIIGTISLKFAILLNKL